MYFKSTVTEKKKEMKNLVVKISQPSVKNEKVTVDCILRSRKISSTLKRSSYLCPYYKVFSISPPIWGT